MRKLKVRRSMPRISRLARDVEKKTLDVKAEGFDVRMVYSITDCISIAEKTNKDVVFFSIGFETTTPATASVISTRPTNFSILCAHRLIPPAMEALIKMGEMKIDGYFAEKQEW